MQRRLDPFWIFSLLCFFPAPSWGSSCFDHYNPSAWSGKGLAMVFCRDNSDAAQGSFLSQCELRKHNGAKLQGLTRHGSLDNGRLVYTDYNTLGAKFSFAVDIVCKTKAGATVTFPLASGAKSAYGCCRNKQYGGVACCGTGGGVTPDAGSPADLAGPSPDMVNGSGYPCKDLLSTTHGAPLVQLKAGSAASASFSIPGLPAPSGLSKVALVMTLDDADHPGAEGWIRVNGKGPLQLPASAAWNNVKVVASAPVPLGYLSAGVNTVAFSSNTSPYRVGDVLLRAWGPACKPAQGPDAAPWPSDSHARPPDRDQAAAVPAEDLPGGDQAPGPGYETISGGCSCRVPSGRDSASRSPWFLALGLSLLAAAARRRGGPRR